MQGSNMGGVLVKPLPSAQRENDIRPPVRDAIYRRAKITQPIVLPGSQPSVHTTLNGLSAQTIVVDNFSKQYLFLSDANIWVNPGQLGKVVPVKDCGNLNAEWGAPPGITQPAVGVGPAVIQCFEDVYPPSAGITVAGV